MLPPHHLVHVVELVVRQVLEPGLGSLRAAGHAQQVHRADLRVGSQTDLRLSGGAPGDDIDFERDLNLPNTTTQAYIEAFWRPGRRHQLSVSFTRIKRDGGSVLLEDEVEWGDVVFPVGAEISGTNDSDFVDPIRIVRERFDRRVVVISPDAMVGKQLAKVASFARPLDRDLLARCQLPDAVADAAGRAISRLVEWRRRKDEPPGVEP